MKLHEALQATKCASKHVDSPVAGTYSVSKANLSGGYFEDFKADDPKRRSPFATSVHYGPDELNRITRFAGEDGWEPR